MTDIDHPVGIALETYTENIRRLIEYLSEYESDEHGFYSSLTAKINKNFAEYGDSIPDQYVPDWYNHRKANKRGLDMISAVKLGYGGGLSKDPNLACALVYLALTGIWDVDVESLSSITTRLTGVAPVTDDDSSEMNSAQLDRIEMKIDTIIDATKHTLTKSDALRWSIVKELTEYGMQPTKDNIPKIKKILETHAVGIEDYIPDILDIIQNDKRPEPKYWLLICTLLNKVNPDGKYTPKLLKSWINQEARRDNPNVSPSIDPGK